MSDSRLEKFIYAICSMDVSDLPVPLSRIEILWNCLITGETPDFEPLSRNEKYLMAMLDRYDISNLPAPMSRGEQLLYKIAVGETDLSDVPGYLSRYEELLKYLIENGEISGGDFEYVLYTLNQSLNTLYLTAEKPVKSAILKGRTLVNINRPITRNDSMKVENGLQILTTWSTAYNLWMVNDITLFKTNTKYYIIVEVVNNTLTSTWSPMIGSKDCVFSDNLSSLNFASKETGIKCATFTTKSDFTNVICGLRSATGVNETVGSILKFRIAIIEYQEGMENWDIPYFEGMQSVKMPVLTTTGKNLFDGKLEYGIISGTNGRPYNSNDYVRTQDFIPINYEKITYTVINEQCGLSFYFYDKDKNFISSATTMNVNGNLSIPEGVAYLKFRTYPLSNESVTTNLNTQIQLEEGSTATPYEPYKSNILTVNEDVTLRGIGDVQDELNCLTGELTQRIGEVVFDGSDDEKWWYAGHSDTIIRFNTTINMMWKTQILCSDIQVDTPNIGAVPYRYEGITNHVENYIYLYLKKEKFENYSDDLSNGDKCEVLKNWLSKNSITIQYQLATESIKTVDLTVVDQDGNVTTLKTFDDTTHVLLNSEGLIPTAVLTVRTKIPSASSTSLLMDDILTKQEQLNTTIDEQSENVDVTMIATTEIYEETL